MLKLRCPKCERVSEPQISGSPKSGMHVKASCSRCGAYIKFLGKSESLMVRPISKKRSTVWNRKLSESKLRLHRRNAELAADAANKARAKRILEGIDD